MDDRSRRSATSPAAEWRRPFETVGEECVIAHAFAATRRGGRTVIIGLTHPDRILSILFPRFPLRAGERVLEGS